MNKKTAVIIGAGPAGLTAALELLEKTDIIPVIYEATGDIGGISKTVNHKGNRIDIGGHRFFSKAEKIMQWWQNILPFETKELDPKKTDKIMLLRNRVSRIFFLRKFFDYPISLNLNTFNNLGFIRVIKIGMSYIKARIFPVRNEISLEDFFINRFGKELYLTFFKDYTEKVWGIPCNKIKADWGAQRIKGLSISGAIIHAIKKCFPKKSSIAQKDTETSLIDRFIYPKFGPGQLWNEVANRIREKGGEIHLNHKITGLKWSNNQVTEVLVKDESTGNTSSRQADFFLSSMPVRDLISSMGENVSDDVQEVSKNLIYRDFITVGLLLNKLEIENQTKIKTANNMIPDNWIYIQERDVKLGRLQIFNNWSPYMVKDSNKIWIGLEYFCNENDELWNKPENEFIDFAVDELVKIKIINKKDVLDSVLIKMPKAYPAYFGTYDRFYTVRQFTDKFENLFLIGRNGMHRYNNMDHSMLAAMTAVENIVNNVKTKDNIWLINTEEEYHEKK